MGVFAFFSYSSRSVEEEETKIPTIVVSTPSETVDPEAVPPKPRRFSIQLTRATDLHKKTTATFLKHTRSDKRAKKSALLVRELIIGPSTSSAQLNTSHARPQLNQLKSQLTQPKSANKVISHLRALPSGGNHGPIHAVCLAHTDTEVQNHFCALAEPKDNDSNKDSKRTGSLLDGLVPLDEVSSMFDKMDIVSLITSPPTLGIGQPGDGPGILSGAVPTAETVLKGFEQVTPQLMALGYAVGGSVLVDHKGVYPPTDRMSVITYWWGLELVLPPPSLKNLASAHSISGSVINLLSALAVINNGVREILPFVRYIGQFIDFEFDQIMKHDKGQGVVCASTWIMPAALVPRPWDFAPPPPTPTSTPAPALDGVTQPLSAAPTAQLTQVPPSPPQSQPTIIPPSKADNLVDAHKDPVTLVPPEVAAGAA